MIQLRSIPTRPLLLLPPFLLLLATSFLLPQLQRTPHSPSWPALRSLFRPMLDARTPEAAIRRWYAGLVQDAAGERSSNESNQASASSSSSSSSSCPASCFRPNPVCGMDGRTYWCGAADAECAGTQVEYVGYCDVGSRGTGSKGVLAVQSLLLVHMIWLLLAGFLVLLGIP